MAGPVAFAAAFETRYALVHYMCVNHAPWLSWLIIIGGLLVTAFGAVCSWRTVETGFSPSGRPDAPLHIRFMAIGGLIIGAMFALAIVALAIPGFFLSACE